MPIFPVQQVSRRVLAALLLPSVLQMQSSPTENLASMVARLHELEKILEEQHA